MSYAVKYDRHKDVNRRAMAEGSRRGRNIGGIGWVRDPERRLACSRDLDLSCRTYFPLTFSLPWSDDHRAAIAKLEECTLQGGLFAYAMPRGTGKTSLCEAAGVWAALNGHRDFLALIGADEDAAEGILDSIKTELESNELLAEDYPEVCFPIGQLEGISNRCGGQLYNDARTHIGWTSKEVILPTVRPEGWFDDEVHRRFVRGDGYSLASGATIKVSGITGGIRGMKHKTADGRSIRPSLVIVDDPQTDASARSPSQCEQRERILAGAILGLAGPGRKIAVYMPCTVIRPGDMADNILDREKHPRWNGTRTRMVVSFPSDEKLWEEYARLRQESFRAGGGGREATEFYAANREAMDAGAVVAWPERFNHDEISAVQHAMNLKIDNERAFWSECQNRPMPDDDAREDDLTPDAVLARINRRGRGEVPTPCSRVTAFVDVHATVLYWAVAGWEDDFTGYLLDYGTFPDQERPYFTQRDAKRTLEHVVPGAGLEGRVYGGLRALTDTLLAREWPRDDGGLLKIERCLIDANWGTTTAVVKQFCRESAHSGVITPSHGKYIGASGAPMSEWQKRPGDRIGLGWRQRSMEDSKAVRSVLFDSNFWKSFLLARLSVALGDRGSLTIFGDKPDRHRLLADHLCSEFRVPVEGRGRRVDEWKIRPERPDNHWLDCLVGCCVGAAMQGVALPQSATASPVARVKRVSFADLQRQRRA